MHPKEIENLRRVWGNQPCEHPAYVNECDSGEATGDQYCLACGRMLSREACEGIDARRLESE